MSELTMVVQYDLFWLNGLHDYYTGLADLLQFFFLVLYHSRKAEGINVNMFGGGYECDFTTVIKNNI